MFKRLPWIFVWMEGINTCFKVINFYQLLFMARLLVQEIIE